jgi:hypothetical protein
VNWPWRLRVSGGLCHGRMGISGRRESSVGSTRVRNRISGAGGQRRLILEPSLEWGKVYALLIPRRPP